MPEQAEGCLSMSREVNYALVRDGKIENIILCNDEIIEQFSQDLGVDSFVELTDSNYFNLYSKCKIGDWVDGTSFVWSSWTKNEDGTFTPPIPQPTDGRVYEWRENAQEWFPVTPYPSWIWDPVARVSTPPHVSPEGMWMWNENRLDWDPLPEQPQDGGAYEWDAAQSKWVLVS